MASRPQNVVIYATSNRRHLLRETFSDRGGDEVHHADTVQEAVSLSDRFGISLTFLMPDKQKFLDIVEQIAVDRGLAADKAALLAAAERWALERGRVLPATPGSLSPTLRPGWPGANHCNRRGPCRCFHIKGSGILNNDSCWSG